MTSTDALHANLHTKLDTIYTLIQSLTPQSPTSSLAQFGTYFSPNSKIYLKSMREHETPAYGPEGAIQSLKENLDIVRIEERRVICRSSSTTSSTTSTSSSTSTSTSTSSSTPTSSDRGIEGEGTRTTIFCEMKNKLLVLGEILDPFYETAVLSFNEEGLITEWKMYSCRSHVVAIVQMKTGMGPYSEREVGDLLKGYEERNTEGGERRGVEVEGCGC